jgi:succinate dehydrogenase / fumarate reductase iron-sulfur subunit
METIRLNLLVWRQANPADPGRMVPYTAADISPEMSFLEMIDVVNEGLIKKGEPPIAFDSDCREGICGMCSLVVNGVPHGPDRGSTVCQLHMRRFRDGDTITIEPWRAKPFPVQKDLIVDRGAFDALIASGGFVSVGTGSAPDGNSVPVPKDKAELAMDAAACIGCGACVAACKNASAALFVSQDLTARAAAAGPPRTRPPCPVHGVDHGRARLRQLFERGRVRSGLSEGDPHFQYRAHATRVHAGDDRRGTIDRPIPRRRQGAPR